MAKKKGKEKKGASQMSLGDLMAAQKRKKAAKALQHDEFKPTLPVVDLFSDGVREPLEIKKTKIMLVAVAGLVVIGSAGMWVTQGSSITQARENLATAQSESTSLKQDIQALTPIKSLYDEITLEEGIVNSALATEVTTTNVLEHLNAALGASNSSAKSVSIKYSGGTTESEGKNAGSGCPIVDPFSTVVSVGCIALSGNASDRDGVVKINDLLKADPIFTNIYTSNTTASDASSVQFTVSANITPEALTLPAPKVDEKTKAAAAEADQAVASASDGAAAPSASASPDSVTQ